MKPLNTKYPPLQKCFLLFEEVHYLDVSINSNTIIYNTFRKNMFFFWNVNTVSNNFQVYLNNFRITKYLQNNKYNVLTHPQKWLPFSLSNYSESKLFFFGRVQTILVRPVTRKSGQATEKLPVRPCLLLYMVKLVK